MTPAQPHVNVAVVHYRSGGMLLDLLADLFDQRSVQLSVHVVESGDDGTVSRAEARFPKIVVHRPGRNVGYAGGNNLAFKEMDHLNPILVVNPDVRLSGPHVVATLLSQLRSSSDIGAVAPIIRDAEGVIEYAGSFVDRRRAVAVHTETHQSVWPSSQSTRRLSWLDGACLMMRRETVDSVGGFDERFFLIVEEVDWCLRASEAGWTLLLHRDSVINHQRSSSFSGSTKSAYYAARNGYLLFLRHGRGNWWRLHWARISVRNALRADHRSSGASRQVLRGMLHALIGVTGPAPEDRS